MYKKIIIGASSSGLYAGINLVRNGIDCIVFEKREDEKIEKRTLIVTPEILKFLPVPEEIILNKIYGFELYSKNEKIYLKIKEPDLIIERKLFLKYLEKIAISEKMKILKGREFKRIFKEGKRWLTEFEVRGTDKKEYYNFDRIIGADGAQSKFAKCLDIHIPKVYLVQAKVRLPLKWNKNTVKIWFDKKFTDYFIWFIPDSKYTGVCGLCAENKDVKTRLDRFLKELNLEVIEYQGGITSRYYPSFYPEVNFDGVKGFLIGDAGLQVKMTTVGGTFLGLWGSFVVSNSIAKGIPLKKLYTNLKRELDIHFYIREVLSRMEEKEYDELLLKVSKRLKGLFYEIPRDRARRFFFKMLFKEPYILKLGLKKMIKRCIKVS